MICINFKVVVYPEILCSLKASCTSRTLACSLFHKIFNIDNSLSVGLGVGEDCIYTILFVSNLQRLFHSEYIFFVKAISGTKKPETFGWFRAFPDA
jgi:hypothetical protein